MRVGRSKAACFVSSYFNVVDVWLGSFKVVNVWLRSSKVLGKGFDCSGKEMVKKFGEFLKITFLKIEFMLS